MEEYKQITKEYYNKNAPQLERKYRTLIDEQKEEINHFLELLPAEKRVLDLGSGAGDHSLYFMEKGCKVTAIDFSESMVLLAREKGVNARVMDIENMDFERGSFDGIWAVTSLLHLTKKSLPGVIKNIHDLLVPGGVFYVCVREGRGERFVADAGNTETKRYFAFWERNELSKLFEGTFTLESFKEVSIKEKFFLEYFFQKKV